MKIPNTIEKFAGGFFLLLALVAVIVFPGSNHPILLIAAFALFVVLGIRGVRAGLRFNANELQSRSIFITRKVRWFDIDHAEKRHLGQVGVVTKNGRWLPLQEYGIQAAGDTVVESIESELSRRAI